MNKSDSKTKENCTKSLKLTFCDHFDQKQSKTVLN